MAALMTVFTQIPGAKPRLRCLKQTAFPAQGKILLSPSPTETHTAQMTAVKKDNA